MEEEEEEEEEEEDEEEEEEEEGLEHVEESEEACLVNPLGIAIAIGDSQRDSDRYGDWDRRGQRRRRRR